MILPMCTIETGLGVSFENRDLEKFSISITVIFDRDLVSIQFRSLFNFLVN
ncbi:unnamed protein product [Meloidogyne enterolobii]|uniref:Uncharacterized protein n=1 Tax=Meloidogyne enterolobii TaxID=390850 RepID=A0ACB0XUG0_MELEN